MNHPEYTGSGWDIKTQFVQQLQFSNKKSMEFIDKILEKEYEHFGYDVSAGKQLGLLSEEVAETIPELAIMKDGKPKNVDYEKLSVILLTEVQSLKKEIEELKK